MTIAEIARRAGVSIATVSRVLNNDQKVRPETAQKVLTVLNQFPYDRSAVRRGPRPGKRPRVQSMQGMRTGEIAIAIVGESHERWFKLPLFASIVSSITRAAADRQLTVRLVEVLDADDIAQQLSTDLIDGALVFVASSAKPELLERLRGQLPVVWLLGDDLLPVAVDQVRADNLAIGHLAFRYLFDRGCRSMACVTSRADHGGLFVRLTAFLTAAVREGNLQPKLYTVGRTSTGPWCGVDALHCDTLEAVVEHLASTIASGNDASRLGIFVTQDIETLGLYPLLAARGIRPAQDLQIISCNNEASLSLLAPRPASIDLDPGAIGRWAVRRLVNRVRRPHETPVQMLIKPALVRPEIVDE